MTTSILSPRLRLWLAVWHEFKATLFPWVAALLLAAIIHGVHTSHLRALQHELDAMRVVNTQLAAQVGRFTDLLATQGYVASPFRPSLDK